MSKVVIDDTAGDMIAKIEQVEAEIERLRAALREIRTHDCGILSYEIARRALEGK